MPDTNAPTIMIGEKGAELVLATTRRPAFATESA